MGKKAKDKSIIDQIEKSKVEEKKKAATTDLYLHCRGHATLALNKLHGGELDVSAVFERLGRSVDNVLDNNTNEIEAMLITQAKSLEYMFYDALAKLASSSIEHAEVIANIALRAQAGCRKALSALIEIKHPRRATTFIKQQNYAVTQQVNNSVKSEPHPIEIKKATNELNAKVPYETKKMDIGTTITAGSTNTPAEAMGVLKRSKNC